MKKWIYSALFLSIGMVLPFLTSQVKEFGDTLLPMHLPIFLCGIICGAECGVVTGLMLPFLRSILFGMPPLYPNAIWMALELATYGLVIGILYRRKKNPSNKYLCFCLLVSMIAGRIVWGIAKAVLLGLHSKQFTLHAFVVGGFVDAVPGIILQFVLIPSILKMIQHQRKKNFDIVQKI